MARSRRPFRRPATSVRSMRSRRKRGRGGSRRGSGLGGGRQVGIEHVSTPIWTQKTRASGVGTGGASRSEARGDRAALAARETIILSPCAKPSKDLSVLDEAQTMMLIENTPPPHSPAASRPLSPYRPACRLSSSPRHHSPPAAFSGRVHRLSGTTTPPAAQCSRESSIARSSLSRPQSVPR